MLFIPNQSHLSQKKIEILTFLFNNTSSALWQIEIISIFLLTIEMLQW